MAEKGAQSQSETRLATVLSSLKEICICLQRVKLMLLFYSLLTKTWLILKFLVSTSTAQKITARNVYIIIDES